MFAELFESSIALNIQYYSSQAFQAIVNLLGQIEQLGIGSSREFFRDPPSMLSRLTHAAQLSEEGYSILSLGYLGGNYAVITPKSQSQLMALINQFDQEELSRRGHASFKFFSGNEFLIISDTGHSALSVRKNLSRFLNPHRLVHPTLTEIEKNIDSDTNIQTRRTISAIVRAVLLENILGIKQLPLDTYDVMEAYRNDVQRWGAFPFPELLNLMQNLRKKRDTYKAFSRSILNQEFENLVEILHTDNMPENANLIAAAVVSLFKDHHPTLTKDELLSALRSLSTEEIREYFENPIVQSLPILLKAADNLTDTISLCLHQITTDPRKLKILADEIELSNLDIREPLNIRQLKALPILDAFYKESIRFGTPIAIPRYTQAGYSSDSINIPPNTMVVFDLYPLAQGAQYWTNPKEFDPGRFLQPAQQHAGKEEITSPANNHYLGQFPFVPFFAGQRMCPAFAVTEVLFKVILAKLVADYELQFVNNGDGDFTLHIEPKFKFPELTQYTVIP